MARFLFVPVPVEGHVAPALALAAGVTGRGHEVSVYTGSRFRAGVERAGARLEPFRRAPDLEYERLTEILPGRPEKPGIAQARWDLTRVVIDLGAEQYEDLCEIVDEARPDAVVSDAMGLAGMFVAKKRSLPLAVLNPLNLFLPSRDTFPDGLGVAPSRTALGRLRNRLANWLMFEKVLGQVNRHLHRVMDELGIPGPRAPLMAMPGLVSDLLLQPTIPEFEYPRSDLPPHVHFIGALLPPGPRDWEEPDWWPRLREGRPVVLLTQGTVATDFDELLRPGIAALAGEDVLVLATTGNRDVAEIGLSAPNLILHPFVPFGRLMPLVDVMVTNGGYGGIHFALTHGVPLVVAGRSEDKAETTARVAWSGVGINLRSQRPAPARIRHAVMDVLAESHYRERARAMRASFARLDGPTRGAELLEALVAAGTAFAP